MIDSSQKYSCVFVLFSFLYCHANHSSDLRQRMDIGLRVTPRHIFRGMWEPHGRLKDLYREELIGRLTTGWDDWQIVRSVPKGEEVNAYAKIMAGEFGQFDENTRSSDQGVFLLNEDSTI
jgi:hypothetical protein